MGRGSPFANSGLDGFLSVYFTALEFRHAFS